MEGSGKGAKVLHTLFLLMAITSMAWTMYDKLKPTKCDHCGSDLKQKELRQKLRSLFYLLEVF